MVVRPVPVSYDHIQGVMALTLFEDFVYWTDGKSKSLRRAHKTTGAQGIELLNSWQAIKSIKVYHSLRQPEGMKSIWRSCSFCPPVPSGVRVVSGLNSLTCFCLLCSSQAPVSDCEWRMQPPVSPVPRRGTQMCLSHEFLFGGRQQNLPLQLHVQSGERYSSLLLLLS